MAVPGGPRDLPFGGVRLSAGCLGAFWRLSEGALCFFFRTVFFSQRVFFQGAFLGLPWAFQRTGSSS